MIDIHCHLLPGIDDGPQTLEQSMALAKALVDDGVQHVVCTPHVFPGRYENRCSSIADDFAGFATALAASRMPLEISWAGEVRLTPEILDLLPQEELPFLGLADGRHNMLLELPDGQIPLGTSRLVALLQAQRIRPVIVHPERNRAIMDKPDRLQPFIAQGCAVQVTAGSLLGDFGDKAQAAAQHFLLAGWVTAIASDAHNLKGRAPRMAPARAWLEKHHGAWVAEKLTVHGPAWLCGRAA